MEALSASRDLREPCKVQKSAAPLKTEAVFDPVTITAGAEEAGQSTAYCSSEEELSGAELYISEDERQDSDFVPQKTQQQQQQPAAYQQASGTQQHIPPQLAQQPTPTMAPYTYTVTSMDGMTMDQAPTSWLKPRIKIDGPEVFHGLLRANDENLPPTETIPSTETFVAFKGQWRVVTSAGTSAYVGPTMNPWDPSTAAYPLPITYKVADDAPVVRETPTGTSRANARLGFLERARRFFCTSVAEYMQS